MVGMMVVVLSLTTSWLMFGTADLGIVTFANAVVPLWPEVVKLTCVELLWKLVTVASLVRVVVQPVPQLPDWVWVTLNVTPAEWVNDPLDPVTVTVVI
jgi:hypothetical protein